MIGFATFLSHSFAADSSSGVAALGIDVKALILQIISFLIVFWLLKKFAWSRIVAVLEERHKTIENGVTLGLEMEAEKQKLADLIAQKLKEGRAQADEIINKARLEANEIVKAAETAASHKTETMLKDAQARMEEDIKRARQALEQDLLSLVADATEAVIGEKLDTKKDNDLIQKALSEVSAR